MATGYKREKHTICQCLLSTVNMVIYSALFHQIGSYTPPYLSAELRVWLTQILNGDFHYL